MAKYLYWFPIALLLFSTADAAEVPQSLLACMGHPDDALRLGCYDRAMSDLQPQLALPAAKRTTPAAVASDAQLASDFGKEARMDEEREQLEELSASVAGVETRANGKRIFTLDNGQVWAEQSESKQLRVDTGDRIRIRAGSLGSFRLFASGKVSTRVERVR
jgi:hypothetical protein